MPKLMLWDHQDLKTLTVDEIDYIKVNEILGSSTMTVHVFNKQLEAYVDDEGLLVDDPKYGAVWQYPNGKVIQGIGGKILFVNHNDEGETVSLTYRQIDLIKNLKRKTLINQKGEIYQALEIEYF